MASAVPGYEYDVFISYRHNDNRSGWVSAFVDSLRNELSATVKEKVSIYFDVNPYDGIGPLHDVEDSLREKLRSVIFIPLVSQTYCDPSSYAWNNELLAFRDRVPDDTLGMKVKLSNGNVASRILPVFIHDVSRDDRAALHETLGPVRGVEFMFRGAGINRPLEPGDEKKENAAAVSYRDQINQLANHISAVLFAAGNTIDALTKQEPPKPSITQRTKKIGFFAGLAACIAIAVILYALPESPTAQTASIAVLPFRNNTGSADFDYYGVGMASEISTRLSTSKAFAFISSLHATLPYGATSKPLKEIGEELGVEYVIAGIYRMTGSRMKVETEFINVETGQVIWALPVEGETRDIFTMQQRIADEVLKRFAASRSADNVYQPSIAAYAHYVKGNQLLQNAYGDSVRVEASYAAVIAQYEKAIALDSSYIDAWADLIGVESFIYGHAPDDSVRRKKIESYVHYFNERFPDTWQKSLVKGHFHFRIRQDYDSALQMMYAVLKEHPDNVHATFAAFAIHRRKLEAEPALQMAVKLIQLNPGHAGSWVGLSGLLAQMGHHEDAHRAALKAWNLSHAFAHAENAMNTAMLAGASLDALPTELKKSLGPRLDLVKHAREFKWNEVKQDAMALKRFGVVASICADHGQRDSAIFYWKKQSAEEKAADSASWYFYKGDHAMAFASLYRLLNKYGDPANDQVSAASRSVAVIDLHLKFGEYEIATTKLLELNKRFPGFREHLAIFSQPWYDRARKQYPPFEKALRQTNNNPQPTPLKNIDL